MPKQRRWSIKRTLDNTIAWIEKAETKLADTAQPFKELHPDYFQEFCDVIVFLEAAKSKTANIRDKI